MVKNCPAQCVRQYSFTLPLARANRLPLPRLRSANTQNVKSLPNHKALISVSLALRHKFTLPDHGYGATASRGVLACALAFAGTHCAYLWKDEFTCVAGYIPRWFVYPFANSNPSKY